MVKKFQYTSIYLLFVALSCVALKAQTNGTITDLISKSQAEGASGMLFQPEPERAKELAVKNYTNPKEFTIRRGVPNFIAKCKNGEDVRVGFIGGSITQSNYMWRNQTLNYLSSIFPDVHLEGINAGIGGTGSDLGACRFSEHILKYDPDLLFIEFAVNGANEFGVEGIIRQAIRHNPNMDICLVYTIYKGQTQAYATGDIPQNIQRLDRVAHHYHLPSVHMGLWASELERDGKLLWAGSSNDAHGKILFSKDGVHPLEAGGNLYAAAVSRAFNAMNTTSAKNELTLIAPLHPHNLEWATTIDPAICASRSKGWKIEKSNEFTQANRFHDWFKHIATADQTSEPLRFSFEGNMLGFHDLGYVDCGAIDIFVNGKKFMVTKENRFNAILSSKFVNPQSQEAQGASRLRFSKYCDRLRTQYDFIKLPTSGRQDIEIRVNPAYIDKATIMGKASSKLGKEYDPQRIHIGWILINGKLL